MFSAQRIDNCTTKEDLEILGTVYYVHFDVEAYENGRTASNVDNVVLENKETSEKYKIKNDDFLYELIQEFILTDCIDNAQFKEMAKDAFISASEEWPEILYL